MRNKSLDATTSDAGQLLLRLIQSQGHLRESGTEWCLYTPRNKFERPVDQVAPALVQALRAKGHLVARAGGGLEPRQLGAAASNRFGDQRPPRAVEEQGESGLPLFNDAESPLAWLRSRKDKAGRPILSAEQFMAGEKLRADYERSCLQRRVTASWDPAASASSGGGNGAAGISDMALVARDNFNAALDGVGPELASILVQVCCLSAGIEQAERVLELPQRSGKAVLGLALTGLARHYGFLRAGGPRRRSGHWAVEDYRPAIPSGEGA